MNKSVFSNGADFFYLKDSRRALKENSKSTQKVLVRNSKSTRALERHLNSIERALGH